MNNIEHFREIAQELRKLRLSSPRTGKGLGAWHAECDRFIEKFRARFPKAELPAQVIHFLNDADIRISDPQYRSAQCKRLDEVIAELGRGSLAKSSGLSIAVRPQWLVAATVVLAAVVYWFFW